MLSLDAYSAISVGRTPPGGVRGREFITTAVCTAKAARPDGTFEVSVAGSTVWQAAREKSGGKDAGSFKSTFRHQFTLDRTGRIISTPLGTHLAGQLFRPYDFLTELPIIIHGGTPRTVGVGHRWAETPSTTQEHVEMKTTVTQKFNYRFSEYASVQGRDAAIIAESGDISIDTCDSHGRRLWGQAVVESGKLWVDPVSGILLRGTWTADGVGGLLGKNAGSHPGTTRLLDLTCELVSR